MDPSSIVSTLQAAGGVIVWGHVLVPFVPTGYNTNATAYIGIVANHVHPLMTTPPVFCVKFKAQTVSHWLLKHNDEDFSPAQHLWNAVKWFASWTCSWETCRNSVMLSCQCGQKKVYLIKWPISLSTNKLTPDTHRIWKMWKKILHQLLDTSND